MSAKRFRHRFQVTIYDSTPLDREVIDYLATFESSHAKQEFLRSLIRAGYSSIMKNRNNQQAALDSLDPETLAIALQTLSSLKPSQERPPEYKPPEHVHITEKTEKPMQEHLIIPKPIKNKLPDKKIEPRQDVDFESRDYSDSIDDDDDLADPLSMLLGEGARF